MSPDIIATIQKRLDEYQVYAKQCLDLKLYPMPISALTKQEKDRVKFEHFLKWKEEKLRE